MIKKINKIILIFIGFSLASAYASDKEEISQNNENKKNPQSFQNHESEKLFMERQIEINLKTDFKINQNFTMKIYNSASSYKTDAICTLTLENPKSKFFMRLPEKDGWRIDLSGSCKDTEYSFSLFTNNISMTGYQDDLHNFLMNVNDPSTLARLFFNPQIYYSENLGISIELSLVIWLEKYPLKKFPRIHHQEPQGFMREEWEEKVKTRGKMIEYQNFNQYEKLMEKENRPKILVVGCGHNAFKFDTEINAIIGLHNGYDCFSHQYAFTINHSIKYNPDMVAFFPNKMYQKKFEGKFDEIYFENNINTKIISTTWFIAAHELLKPGGKLIVDCHEKEGKVQVDSPVSYFIADFENIQFHKWSENPYNLRKSDVITGHKPLHPKPQKKN